MWGDSYTITFGNNASSATAISSTVNATTAISDGTSYVTSKPFTVNSGNCYYGDTKTCIRIGKSGISSSLSIALSSSGQVSATTIVVKANNPDNKNNKDAKLNVNGVGEQTTTGTADDYTFTINDDITSITLSGDKSIYIYSITVNYSAGCTNGTITYSAGSTTYTGGNAISGSHANDTKVCGSNLTLPGATFTTTGYTQDGWATSDGGEKVYNLSATNYATEGNATLYPHWAANNYTVTWMNNGSQHTTTQVAYGSKPTFPSNPSSCDATCTAFYGWTTATWTGKLDDVSAKTIYLSGDAMPAVSGAVTYYAVFAKESATAFERITSADNIYIGQKIAIVSNKQDYILPSNFNATTAATHPNSNDSKLTVTSSQVWTITDIDEYGYYKLKNSTTQMGVNRTSGLTSGSAAVGNYSTVASWWAIHETTDFNYTVDDCFYMYNWATDTYYNFLENSGSSWLSYYAADITSGNKVWYAMKLYQPERSEFLTTCCTPLGAINGSIIFINVLWV